MEKVCQTVTHDPRVCSDCIAVNEAMEEVDFIRRKLNWCQSKITNQQLEQALLNYQDPLWIASQIGLSSLHLTDKCCKVQYKASDTVSTAEIR